MYVSSGGLSEHQKTGRTYIRSERFLYVFRMNSAFVGEGKGLPIVCRFWYTWSMRLELSVLRIYDLQPQR